MPADKHFLAPIMKKPPSAPSTQSAD